VIYLNWKYGSFVWRLVVTALGISTFLFVTHVSEVWFLITLNASTLSINTNLFYILVYTEYICIFCYFINTTRVNHLEI
jgi:hypothetical protein